MAVICLNCEGWGCEACKVDREAAKGGEQGPSPLDLQVQHLRDEVKRCRDGQGRLIAARDQLEQLVVEQRDLLLVLRTQRDALLAEVALLRIPGGSA